MATEIIQSQGQSDDLEPAMQPEVFYYAPWCYLRTMFLIAWSAFAHPFSTTVIDLETGAMRHEHGEDAPQNG